MNLLSFYMAVAETFRGEIESKLEDIVPAFQALPYDGTLSIITLATAFRKVDKWTDAIFILELSEAYRLLALQMPDVNIPQQLDLIINNISGVINPQDPRIPLLQQVKEQLGNFDI